MEGEPHSDMGCSLWTWAAYFTPPILVTVILLATPPGHWVYRNRFRWPVSNRISWCVKELPSFLIPLWYLCTAGKSPLGPALLPLSLFALHYFQRSLIYPWRVSSTSTEPLVYVISAFLFTAWNGHLQSVSAIVCSPPSATYSANHLIGVAVFFIGAAINIDSDQRLLGLRRPGGPKYSIPRGGMFEYVTAANYLGEMVEWWGYALVSRSLGALFFAVFTTVYLTGCAGELHERNRQRFDKEYPPQRRRVLPFVY